MQYIQLQSQNPNTLPLPIGGFNIFVDQTDNNLKVKDAAGEVYGGSYYEVTYSGLVDTITTSGLSTGSFYVITDFRTCYDQPDFDYEGQPITTGSTKQAAIEPIMVFGTSVSTISTNAFQPLYPNDRIQYDWTFSETEVTNSPAFGRITERIDEFNNRTDYDHRTILFKRYRLFTHREDQLLNGTIELLDDGTVEGNNTSFTSLTVGDVVYIPDATPNYYEIVTIDDNVTMTVSGDTIGTTGAGSAFYLAVDENNDNGGYFSYKRTNVKTNDFIEYTTFGDAIDANYAKNNYIGNFANSYTNVGDYTFLLANNVFLTGEYESNKFGDYCYNNTFGVDNSNNIWGNWCYENVSTNDIDDCIFGHTFNNNLINTNLTNNHIGNNFNNNKLLAENYSDFRDNIIGNDFAYNTIYSDFYDNQILNDFNDNIIGDFGNVDRNESGSFEFYRNRLGNNFNGNNIKNNFQNNTTGSNFQNNTVNGEVGGNTILNGFNNNQIGNGFNRNQIGNGFNNNTVNDDFYDNTTGYYFYSNEISNQFYRNDIGTNFENNEPTNINLFGWSSLSTVSTRNYELFYDAVNSNFSDNLLGKELVMKIISTSQYFKIKFTQWTQNNGGGGFQYERQEIDTNGNPVGDSVTFTKINYEPMVDIIVEGVVEITRDDNNNNGIYNIVTEGGWDSGVSPEDTEWNSVYTESNNGRNFNRNKIENDFISNTIGNNFQDNQIGNYFEDNDISNNFRNNVIGLEFRNNVILDGFGFGGSNYRGNKIGNYFYDNTIGEYFYDNTISDNFTNNTIGDYFQWNIVNTNVEFEDFTPNYGNITGFTYTAIGTGATGSLYTDIGGTTNALGVDASFNIGISGGTVTGVTINNAGKLYVIDDEITILGTSIGGETGVITTFSSDAIGLTGTTGSYTNVFPQGTSGENGSFDIEVVDGLVDSITLNQGGGSYLVGETLTISGTEFGSTENITITVDSVYSDDVVITVTNVSVNPSVYEPYTCQIFERQGGAKRLSFYDGNDILTITDINV
jgi:hypothetical protein